METLDEIEEYDNSNDSCVERIHREPRKRNLSHIQSHTAKKKRIQNRPKVQFEWSNKEILKLIKAVEDQHDLWDKSLVHFRMPKVLAWQKVAEIIGNYSSDECKAKWNNLRVTFNVNLAKYRSAKSVQGSDERKTITWQYFNRMMFLEASDVRQSSQSKTSSMHLESAITDHSILPELESPAAVGPLPFTKHLRRKINNTKQPSASPLLAHQQELRKRNLPQLQSQTANKIRIQNRPKIQCEWSNKDILKLIKAVEVRPALWDKAMVEYSLPNVLIWQEVVEIIGNYPLDECKAKWNNLRVTFNANLAKYRSAKSVQGSDERKTITWQYFNRMMFLEASDVRQSSQSTSSIRLKSAITDRSNLSELGSPAALSLSLFREERRRKINNTKLPSELPALSPSATISNSNQFKDLATKALNVMNNRAIKDEYSAFGEYIAAELRSMDGRRAAYVKRKLNRAFVDLIDEVAFLDEITPAPMAVFSPSSDRQLARN